ncbi:cytochrome P450 [Micromonospora sp. RHAY321]|uniref:cytochrome P450 n=1 Tax=Micromonospora sp. RHAY321 TaxID=2944807 RepID=UPI00207C578E|nr:cytochrome P450 [Micromonospora sp. RHAY321]MCO1593976.1 cytochrome P450 [Micromonospora sp. RHAY321]
MTEMIDDQQHLSEFPATRTSPFHPPQAYLKLQAQRRLHRVRLPSGLPAVFVTGHDEVRRLLDDERLSADETAPGYPFLYAGAFESPLKGTFMRADGEAHYRIRRMLSKDFTLRRARELRPEVESVVGQCLDDMARAGSADIVRDLAFPVPSRTICGLLGVPYEDREVFETNTRAMIDTTSTQEQMLGAMGAIMAYLTELVAKREQTPSDDLISRLVVEELQAGNLTRDELVTISLILLVGGHETTATMIGLGTFALMEHRDQLDLLLADPEGWPIAVEEILRHQTIVQNPIQRAAVADIPVGDDVIRAGEGVVFVLEAANRDPEAFPDPDRFDVRRAARNHVAFSFGAHQCLGHAIARMELDVVFRMLFERFPTLRLSVPVSDVPLRPNTVGLFGVDSLPVTW